MTRVRPIVGFVAQTKKIFSSFFGTDVVSFFYFRISVSLVFILEVVIFVFEGG